jgi:hypothetical protein
MSRSRIALAVAALFATTLFAAPADAATPVVGKCYNLTYSQVLAASTNAPAVSCTSSHNAKTIGVRQVPNSTDYKHLTDAEAFKLAATLCYPKFTAYLGSTAEDQHLTAYDLLFYIPTQTQRNAGARWMRCDLVLDAGKSIARLPAASNSSPVLTGELPDSIKRCLVTVDSYHLYTTCSRTHSYRSSAAYTVTGTLYRSTSQWQAKGKQLCPTAEYYTWPSKNHWNVGDHVLVCYDRTAS